MTDRTSDRTSERATSGAGASAHATSAAVIGVCACLALVGCSWGMRGGYVSSTETKDGASARSGFEVVIEGGPTEWDVDDDGGVGGAILFGTAVRGFDPSAERREADPDDDGDVLVATTIGAEVSVTPQVIADFYATWFFARFSAALLNVGEVDREFTFGMFAPYFDGGLVLALGDDMEDFFAGFVIGASVGYDVRFVGAGSEGLWSVYGGIRFWDEDFF